MPTVDVRTATGSSAGTVRLDEAIFGVQPNVAVMHQVVTAQLAAARSGNHSTKTRAEVSGGGRKPWRQKGSGRARQGSTRAPHWRGGGVALGPKPRSYRQRTPKKMVQLALHSALSDRAAEGRVAVVEAWNFPTPRTREAKAALSTLGLDGRVLIVLDREEEVAAKSFRNLPECHPLLASELNAYDVLCSDWVVFTRANLPGVTSDTAVSDTAVSDAAPQAPQDEPSLSDALWGDSDSPPREAAPSGGPAPLTPPPPADERDWDAPLQDQP